MRLPDRGLRRLAASTLLLALAAVAVPTAGAGAATTAGWADWQPLAGAAGSWTTTMQLPAGGFPAASVTTDSRGGQVGVQSGASSWLGDATPPGAEFGSSRGEPYLNLRPRADNATSPSTTTYTFDRPTPAGGWAFVLGDIDADEAVVIARDETGQLLTGAELGWQGGFNYCAVTPRPACTGSATDVAGWDPVTGRVTGNTAGMDTSGSSGWFRPTVPVTSLTVYYSRRTGLPVYQTWFASLARDVSGVVDLVAADGTPIGVVPGATLTLLGPDRAALATTTSAVDGSYSFPGYTAAPGYTVELTRLPVPGGELPFGLRPHGQRVVTGVDLSETDATDVDLAAREVVPIAVSGTVRDADGDPLENVTVTLAPVGGGTPFTAVTSSSGEYVIDDIGWDVEEDAPQAYTFGLTDLPAGYTVDAVPPDVVVDVGEEAPSVGNDFGVSAPPTVAGAVTAGGVPVAGAVVTIVGPGGSVTAPTGSDGTYAFDLLPPGEYAVSVEVPSGYTADGPTEQGVTVTGEDVPGIDFALARPGAVGGTVTDDAGEPVPGVTVTVSGPDGPVELVTDEAGVYFLDGLGSGDRTITLTVPDGYGATTTEREVILTAAGENRLDQDFVVSQAAVLVQVGGTVTDTEGYSVPGARIEVRDAQGEVVATVAAGDGGTWSTELPAGSYTARIDPPAGYVPAGDGERSFVVAGVAQDGIDFVLLLDDTSVPDPTDAPTPTGGGAPGTEQGTGVDGTPLAVTGTSAATAVVGALALVLAGAALALVARRRGAAPGPAARED
ncbi:MSCRAMM family protein [Cellulosimicrobium arenosum]|uniref:Carboxypeptidase regulatory-like domain-containing protein n=1 Tax=Cellulosimicrobium arenosum TaxID=2708133 RepID=A0A927J199_9MICO|nr:carboxypeptidase-like regulatory domain-containing protein [Cellulosimicrobium arenosum]MBD8080049.1 carboxypeptidase regulatory-like domain-containing protein [Cellulosimicrobium arenosum]